MSHLRNEQRSRASTNFMYEAATKRDRLHNTTLKDELQTLHAIWVGRSFRNYICADYG